MANWYLESGKDSDVVESSRVRLARNLAKFNFPGASKDELKEVYNKLEEVTPIIGYDLKFLKMDNIDEITKLSLVEKHLISPKFASCNKPNRAIIINDEENICIMVNEEDHIRMQVFSSGEDIENLYNLAEEIDNKLSSIVEYAYSKKYGYLTACPTNVGTGMRASVMVHLPALTLTGNIQKVFRAINNFGMSIRGVYGEGSKSQGAIYQIFNNQSLGFNERELIKNVKTVAEKIVEQEREARRILAKQQLELEDKVYRSYGVLANARKISSDECKDLISDCKLGTDLGIISELNDKKIKELELYTKPGSLQKYYGEQLESYDRDVKRCKLINEIINKN